MSEEVKNESNSAVVASQVAVNNSSCTLNNLSKHEMGLCEGRNQLQAVSDLDEDPHKLCKQHLEQLIQQHKTELERKSFEIEELIKQQSGLEDQVSRTKDEYKQCLQEQTDLKRKLVEKDWKLESLNRELNACKSAAEELRDEKSRLETEMQALKKDSKIKSNRHASSFNESASRDDAERRSEFTLLVQENEKLKHELTSLQTENRDLKVKTNLSSQHDSLELNDLREKMKISSEEKEELNRQIKSQNKKIRDLEAQLPLTDSKSSTSVAQGHVGLAEKSTRYQDPVIYKEVHTTVIEEVDDGSLARLNSMLDLALKKNEKLEFELRVAQKRFASVEDTLKEVEILRATNTELESEIKLYKTRIQSMESRAAVFPEGEAVDELRRAKIEKEVENESLKHEMNILRQKYENMENEYQKAMDQTCEPEHRVKPVYLEKDSDIQFVEQGNSASYLQQDKFVMELKFNFERQVVSLQNALGASQEQCERLQTEQRHLKEEISLLKNLESEADIRHNFLKRDLERMRDEHRRAQLESSRSQNEISDMHKEKENLESQLDQLKNMSNRYLEDGTCKDKQIAELRNMIKNLEEELSTKSEEIRQCKTDFLGLKAESDSLQRTLEKTKGNCCVLKEERKEMEKKYMSAIGTSSSVSSVNKSLEDKIKELSYQTADLANKLEESRSKQKQLQEKLNQANEETIKFKKICEANNEREITQKRDFVDLQNEMELRKKQNADMDLKLNLNVQKERELLQELKSVQEEVIKWKELYESVDIVRTRQERELKDMEEQIAFHKRKFTETEANFYERCQMEKRLQEEVFNANMEVSKWKNQWETANSLRTQMEEEITKLRRQVEELKDVKVETQLKTSSQANSQLEEHVQHTLARLTATEEKMKAIHQQLQEYQLLVQKGKDITQSLEITLHQLRVENSDLEKLVASLREDLRHTKNSLRDSLSRIEEKEQEICNLKLSLRDYQPTLETEEKQIKKCEGEEQSLHQSIGYKTTSLTDSNKSEISEREAVIEDLLKQMEVLKQSTNGDKSKETILKENYSLSLELHSYKEKTKHLERHISDIVDERDRLRAQVVEQLTTIKEKEKAIKHLSHEKDLQERLKYDNNELSNQTQKTDLIFDKDTALFTVEKRNQELEDQVKSLQQKIVSLELGQLNPWTTSTDTVEIKKRDAMINNLQGENLEAKEKVTALKLRLKEAQPLNVFSAQNRIMEDKISNLEYKVQQLQSEKQSLESQLKESILKANPNTEKEELINNLQSELQNLHEKKSLLEFELENRCLIPIDNTGIKHKSPEFSSSKVEKQQLQNQPLLPDSQMFYEMSREDLLWFPLKESRISVLELENKMLEEKLATLKLQLDDFRKKANRVNELPLKEARISSLEFENNYLKERINTLEIQLLDSRKELNSPRVQLMSYKPHHELNVSQLSESSMKSQDQTESCKVELEEKQRKITALELQVQFLKDNIGDLKSSAKDFRTPTEKDILIRHLEKQVGELKEKGKILENKLSSTSQDDENAIKLKLRNLEFDNTLLKKRNEDITKQLDDNFTELMQLKAKESSVRMKIEECERIKQRNEENESLIRELEEVKRALENELFEERMGNNSASENRIRMLECENMFLRERNEAVEIQREENYEELKEKDNAIYQVTLDKKLLVEKMNEQERQISQLQQKNKFLENELSSIRHEPEGLNEVRIRNLELDNKYLQERNQATEAQRDAIYKELRENEDMICKLKTEKNISESKLVDIKQEYENENEKLRKENYARDSEVNSLKNTVEFLETKLQDLSNPNMSFRSCNLEKYFKDLQEKDELIEDLREKEKKLKEEIKKLQLKTKEDDKDNEETKKDDLIKYLRSETYTLRDEIEKMKKQEHPTENVLDSSKEKDELIDYLREETYALRTEVSRLEDKLTQRRKVPSSGNDKSQVVIERLTKENKELVEKQAVLQMELELAVGRRGKVEGDALLVEQKMSAMEEERRKLEAEIQTQAAEKHEMSQELEKEILFLKGENDSYKRIFAEKNNVVSELRLNIADCHKEIENLRAKLQSTDHRTSRTPNKTSFNNDKRDKMFEQNECSNTEEDKFPNQDGDSSPYTYNVEQRSRPTDTGTQKENSGPSCIEKDISNSCKDDDVQFEQDTKISPAAIESSVYPEVHGHSGDERETTVQDVTSRYPQSPRSPSKFLRNPAESMPGSQRLPGSPARSPRNSPRFPRSPARSPQNSPRFPRSPVVSRQNSPSCSRSQTPDPADKVSPTEREHFPKEGNKINSTPANPAPLLIDQVESPSNKEECAIIKGTQVSPHRTTSVSSEVSDSSLAPDNAPASEKPDETLHSHQWRSRRYEAFLQRQSQKNTQSRDREGVSTPSSSVRSRHFGSYRNPTPWKP